MPYFPKGQVNWELSVTSSTAEVSQYGSFYIQQPHCANNGGMGMLNVKSFQFYTAEMTANSYNDALCVLPRW